MNLKDCHFVKITSKYSDFTIEAGSLWAILCAGTLSLKEFFKQSGINPARDLRK